MRDSRLPRRFASLALAVFAGGCALGNNTLADQQLAPGATFSSPLSYQMYNILAAEMYVHQNNPGQAALHYLAAARQNRDVTLARRAAELATGANDAELADKALGLWVELQPDSPEARQYRALLNLRAERYDEAVKDLVVIRQNVDSKEGHGFEFIVSLLAMEPGTANAYEVFRRYVAQHDKSMQAQLMLASMALNAERFEEALTTARPVKASANAQQQVQAAQLAAKALLGLQRIPEAVAELEPVVNDKSSADLKLEYARLLILTDRRKEATPFFKQLYASQPDNTDILYTLGLLYLEQKEYAVAEPLIRQLQADPARAAEASYFMGQLQEGQGHLQEAMSAYQHGVGGIFSREAIANMARLLQSTQGTAASRAWLQAQLQAASTPERKVQVWLVEGQLLYDQQHYTEAVTVFNQANALMPDDYDVLYARSLAHERLNNLQAAEADLRTLVKGKPDNAAALNALGYLLAANTTRYAEAEALLRKALALRPDDAAIQDSMGWLLHRMGKDIEAETWLRNAYTGLPDPEVAVHLMEVLNARGKSAEASHVLQDMLEKFPADPQLLKFKEKQVGL